VHDAEFNLAYRRITKCASVPARGFDTDKNFAVVKRYNVRRVTVAEDLEMQFRDAPIGNEPDGNSIQLPQLGSFPILQLQTTLHSVPCESFQGGDIDRDFSLKVAHADTRGSKRFWMTHEPRLTMHRLSNLAITFAVASDDERILSNSKHSFINDWSKFSLTRSASDNNSNQNSVSSTSSAATLIKISGRPCRRTDR
jgi:hypothetical protein